MKQHTGFSLQLVPLEYFPELKRLQWGETEVSLRDIVQKGIHPAQNRKLHPGFMGHLIDLLNDPSYRPRRLEETEWVQDVPALRWSYKMNSTPTDTECLDYIRDSVYFTGELEYRDLLDMAVAHLRKYWQRSVAIHLLKSLHGSFTDQRNWLKSKDPNLKLSCNSDIAACGLHNALSVDDFLPYEKLILEQAFPVRNYRYAKYVEDITDDAGRLKLLPRISQLSVKTVNVPHKYRYADWKGEVKGEEVRLWPELNLDKNREEAARSYAKEWGMDGGELCFTMSFGKLELLNNAGILEVSFPSLAYPEEGERDPAEAILVAPKMPLYKLLDYPDASWNVDTLKQLLEKFGETKSGDKKKILQKLVNLTAKHYALHKDKLDSYFSKRRFIRIEKVPTDAKGFAVLHEELGQLQQLVLACYIVKHLRGGVLLESAHNNEAYPLKQLAAALLNRQVLWPFALLEIPADVPAKSPKRMKNREESVRR